MKDVLCMTARGEISLKQPAADTLKVILSGHWKLGGDFAPVFNPRREILSARKDPDG
jgi:hypothetical protein